MDDTVYEIRQFPHDGRSWRVDLFGEIDRNHPVPSDPLVEVLMSPLIEERARTHGVASNLAVDNLKRRSFWTNASYLPLIRTCSVWKDGVRLDSGGTAGIQQERFNLSITADTARLVPSDLRLEATGEYLLPKSAYHLGGRGLRVQLLSIDHVGVPHRVLIPVIEIGRFYYFCSSQLTKQLLWGRIDDTGGEVFSMARSRPPVDGIGYVHLHQNIPDKDAWVVSRFAHSPYALSCARKIHDSLSVKAVNGQPLVPDILPPFEGVTDLVARGKWFMSGGERRFLVLWLVSCSHPFPASHLIHSRDLDGRSDGVDDPTRPEINIPPRNSPEAKSSEKKKQLRGDTEPRDDLTRLESLLHDARFTDLAGKTREKIDKPECKFRAAVQPPASPSSTDGWSGGDGTSGDTDAAPITINTSVDDAELEKNGQERPRAPSYPPSIQAVIETIEHLAGLCDIAYRFVHVMGEAGYGYATLFPEHCPQHPRWPYVDGRRRQALVVEINYAGTYHYLFETERWKQEAFTTLYARDGRLQPLSDEVLAGVLQNCARTEGKWFNNGEMPSLDRRKLKHTWTSPFAFATKLLELLKTKPTNDARTPTPSIPIGHPNGHDTHQFAGDEAIVSSDHLDGNRSATIDWPTAQGEKPSEQ